MNDTIICPHCKKPIPLTEALSHQIKEKYQRFYKQRLAEEKGKIEEQLKVELGKKIKKEMELEIRDKSNEIGELRKQNQSLQEQLLELNKLIRQLRTENEKRQLEMEKKLSAEQEKIRVTEQKRIDQEYRMKMLEYEKKIQDVSKANEDLKRKLEQGSQQLQGEVLELELENILRKEFPHDEIKEVPKGVVGADLIQLVKNNYGRDCGSIIWELKRTKVWSDSWINKLKNDQRQVKADIAILISQALPEGVKNFTEKNGIWIGNYDAIFSLSLALRKSLIEISAVKSSIVGRQDKKEVLWNYLTSIEFKQRIEAFYDAYSQLKDDLKKEQEWFRRKWAKQDKNITQLADSILGVHGDLQGIIGKSLPEIKGLEMLPTGSAFNKTTADKEKNSLF